MSETSLKAFTTQNNVRRATVSELRFEEEAEYQAVGFGLLGRRAEIMLEFHKADGYRLTIPYIDIKEIETSNPATGFTVKTAARKITIEGGNLERCYRYLKQNRVAELKEADRPTAMAAPEGEMVIFRLLIKQVI